MSVCILIVFFTPKHHIKGVYAFSCETRKRSFINDENGVFLYFCIIFSVRICCALIATYQVMYSVCPRYPFKWRSVLSSIHGKYYACVEIFFHDSDCIHLQDDAYNIATILKKMLAEGAVIPATATRTSAGKYSSLLITYRTHAHALAPTERSMYARASVVQAIVTSSLIACSNTVHNLHCLMRGLYRCNHFHIC